MLEFRVRTNLVHFKITCNDFMYRRSSGRGLRIDDEDDNNDDSANAGGFGSILVLSKSLRTVQIT